MPVTYDKAKNCCQTAEKYKENYSNWYAHAVNMIYFIFPPTIYKIQLWSQEHQNIKTLGQGNCEKERADKWNQGFWKFHAVPATIKILRISHAKTSMVHL